MVWCLGAEAAWRSIDLTPQWSWPKFWGMCRLYARLQYRHMASVRRGSWYSSEPPTVRSPCFGYIIVQTYRCSREGGSEAWLHLNTVKCACGMCCHPYVAVAMWMVKAGRWQPESALWREISQFALLVCVIIRLLASICTYKWSEAQCTVANQNYAVSSISVLNTSSV